MKPEKIKYLLVALIGITAVRALSCVGASAQPPSVDLSSVFGGDTTKSHMMSCRLTQETKVIDSSLKQKGIVTAKYFDGLGREEQNVIQNGSPSGDLADYTEYNTRGKASRKWLSIRKTSSGGNAVFCPLNTLAGQLSGDTAPYTSIFYENTPEARELESRGPGQAWQNHAGVRKEYRLNSSSIDSLKCRYYRVTPEGVLKREGNYPPGDLHVTVTTDEDGHCVTEFVDKDQHKVLSRQRMGTTYVDTYYVYDVYGNLCYVLPPKASALLSNELDSIPDANEHIQKLCYVYKYDHRNRCIEKKLPGCASICYVYDSCDNLVYSQDGNQRARGKWSFTAYDALGRVAYTGERTLSSTASSLREEYRSVSPRVQFNSSSMSYSLLPGVTMADVNNVNFYDDYSFLGTNRDSLAYRNLNGYDSRYVSSVAPNQSAKGMVTGKMTRVLNTADNLLSAIYYDNHGNVIQSHEQNLLGGYEHYYYHLSFTGKPLAVRHEHTTSDTINVEILRYTYDNMERLLTTTVERDGAAPVLLCSNTYDNLGRLATQSLGGTAEGSHAESLAYAYNVRGWTTGITGSNFRQTLYYENAPQGVTPCFNGNISANRWEQNECVLSFIPTNNYYAYTYDGLNRLVGAAYTSEYGFNPNGPVFAMNNRNYSTAYSYDLNGNMTRISRSGLESYTRLNDIDYRWYGNIDDLSLEYNGNQLKEVSDQCMDLTYEGAMDFKDGSTKATEYTYDANGNMTRDRNKGIHSITYNILNLPQSVIFDDGHETRYTYAADGRKLRVEYILTNSRFLEPTEPIIGGGISLFSGGLIDDVIDVPLDTAIIMPAEQTLMVRDYCGNHIYRNGVLERVLNDVGYADSTGYHYQVKDYRGDVRAVVAQNGTLEETNSYYPYGMLHGTSAIASTQPYKYTAKELDRENGLDWYDFEARMLMSDLGRTTTMDPLAEKYYSVSPYVWCGGNPIRYVDKNGMYSTENMDSTLNCSVVCIFPEDYQNDEALNDDYLAAQESGLPIITVTDIDDLSFALSSLEGLFENTRIYTINSHGTEGMFCIGMQQVNHETNVIELKNGFKNKIIFIGACNAALGVSGDALLSNFSKQTCSTTIGAMHPINAGYRYDGGLGLNEPTYPFLTSSNSNAYKISTNGSVTKTIYDVRISHNAIACRPLTWGLILRRVGL